jgi:hypothetical protein
LSCSFSTSSCLHLPCLEMTTRILGTFRSGGKPTTAATTCTFCQEGKFNDKETGVSACAQCTFAKSQTCQIDADCVYDDCRHPEAPIKAVAGTTVQCLQIGENLEVASQCYAVSQGLYAACPAKDAITSPVGSSALTNCEGFCPEGTEYVHQSKTCQLCPVVLSFVYAYLCFRCMIVHGRYHFAEGIHLP